MGTWVHWMTNGLARTNCIVQVFFGKVKLWIETMCRPTLVAKFSVRNSGHWFLFCSAARNKPSLETLAHEKNFIENERETVCPVVIIVIRFKA